jgi:hypothetical protein
VEDLYVTELGGQGKAGAPRCVGLIQKKEEKKKRKRKGTGKEKESGRKVA